MSSILPINENQNSPQRNSPQSQSSMLTSSSLMFVENVKSTSSKFSTIMPNSLEKEASKTYNNSLHSKNLISTQSPKIEGTKKILSSKR